MKLAAHRMAGTAMSTLTTGVRYLGSNDASYDDPSIDPGPAKSGFGFQKPHPASVGGSFPELVLGNKEVLYTSLSPVFPTNISDFMLGNATAVEGVDATQCAENFADNLECFMILTPGQQLAVAILALTLGTFTVLENFVVLCVILHSQTLRNRPSYHFIGSLAVADLIGSVIFVYSFLDFHVLHRKDSPNVFLFKLAGVIASFTASVGSLFLTAIDRYISIHRPMAYKRIVTKTKAVIAFSMMWTISIIISLLPLLGWNCRRLASVCSDIFPLIDQRYLMFWIGITSILVLFIIYAYMFILWKSHHHAVRMLSRTSQRSIIVYTAEGAKVQTVRPEQVRMDLRLAKTLVMILVALIICWGPLLAIMVYDLFGKVNDFVKTVFAFCSMLCLLNSTVNPVIYAMRSKDLRRAFRSICHMWRRESQALDSSAESDWNSRSMRAAAAAAAAGRAEKNRGRCEKAQAKVAQVRVSGGTESSTAEPV
ncbi:cannabinoid receptor type 1B [Fundulus heteroclitus]|uniref:cannabinoid receptor type 1B n=1 Tax=Fundulus heteroclitus TaxID=8078 RepID=UPI00165A153E|nr:cannabinoid receptor type 1B [Fundulus heteroclitus]